MENTVPIANPNGQAPSPAPQPHIGQAAPPCRPDRAPIGRVPSSSQTGITSTSVLLKLAAARPMYTVPRGTVNLFVPDAQMLFHVLGICDHMMYTTYSFSRSTPAWLPIVSQLYIAVLWNVMLLRVYVHSNCGLPHFHLLEMLYNDLRLGDCLIPGPLVPFFQALASVTGPFDWTGDIVPCLPKFESIWDAAGFHAQPDIARILPVPVILLDQLYHFATHQTNYTTFEWYRNVFQRGVGAQPLLTRIGPQHCGSLFSTQAQFDAARSFWSSVFEANFSRINVAQAQLTDYMQLFGFASQTGETQDTWFQSVSSVMHKYCQYFNNSWPLKSVQVSGLGAVVVRGNPTDNTEARNFIYPSVAMVEPFLSSRYLPRREIPSGLEITFSHADHELIETQAEKYAILTHTNINWSNVTAQNNLAAINAANVHQGDYWKMHCFRHSGLVRLKTQFAVIIASRYHQTDLEDDDDY